MNNNNIFYGDANESASLASENFRMKDENEFKDLNNSYTRRQRSRSRSRGSQFRVKNFSNAQEANMNFSSTKHDRDNNLRTKREAHNEYFNDNFNDENNSKLKLN